MKNPLLFLLIISFLMVCCKKSNDPNPNNPSNPTNNPPELETNLNYSTVSNDKLQIDLSNKISDLNGDLWSIISAKALHGTISISNKIIEYTSNNGFTGNDTIVVTVKDDKGGVSTGKIAITVSSSTPTNHTPTFTSTSTTLSYNDATHILNKTFTLPVSDSDGDNILITSITGNSSNVSISYTDLNIAVTPVNSVYAGVETLQITISDGKETTTSSFTINIGSEPQIETYNILSRFFNKPLNSTGVACKCAQGQYTTLGAGTITTTGTQPSGGFFDYAASAGTYSYTITSAGFITFILSSNASITYNPPTFQTDNGIDYFTIEKVKNCGYSYGCDNPYTFY